jgi:hypothetical protein
MTRRVALVLTALALGGCQRGSVESAPAPLRQAHDEMVQAAGRLIPLLDGATDEAAARAAAPQIRREIESLVAATKRLKGVEAELEQQGRKTEVSHFYLALAARGERSAHERLPDALERVATGPHAPLLREEINAALDVLVAGAPPRQKPRLEKWIQDKNLRK